MSTEKITKNTNNFECEQCHYKCFKKSEWERHINTKKHKINKNDDFNNKKSTKNICICGKIYKERTGLWKHKQKCDYTIDNDKHSISEEENTIINKPLTKDSSEIIHLTNLVIKLMTSNDEIQKQNSDLHKQNNDLHKKTLEMHQQMLDVCKNNNTTINNNNNSKTFNMQVFLNEKCKDAMNIMDFVNSMDLQLSDLEELGELGYVEGISRQMIRKLSELDVYKRPIHCSDLKRETIYVRDNGVWEKENITYDKLRKAIKYVTAKNGYLLEPWRDAHPQCMNTQHPLNDVYVQMMSQAMGGKGEFLESENKIIKKVSKVITIDKKDY